MHVRRILSWAAIFLAAAAGCEPSRTQIKPPVLKEQFPTPPDQTRYNQPWQYPKEAMKENAIQPKQDQDPARPGQGGLGGRQGFQPGMQ
jgi:hypothetical protein